jgi:MoxR-like ATPase
LFAVWSGDPAVVVASPPGAGKTRLVVHLAEQLNRRAQLTVAIATQTRAQVLDVTNRAPPSGRKWPCSAPVIPIDRWTFIRRLVT